MTRIANLTQHVASPEQIEAGVFNFEPAMREQISELLTFNEMPTKLDVVNRANALVDLINSVNFPGPDESFTQVMIDGAPWMMKPLIKALEKDGYVATFAVSKREVVETVDDTRAAVKKFVFRHLGFIPA